MTEQAMLFRFLILFSLSYLANSEFVDRIFEEYGNPGNGSLKIRKLAEGLIDGRYLHAKGIACEEGNCNRTCFELLPNSSNWVIKEDFEKECPRILYSLTQDCMKSNSSETKSELHEKKKPTAAAVWGYGFLTVTIVNLCAVAGIFMFPMMGKDYFSSVLVFLIALAVGTLSTTSALILIPETFGITEMDGYLLRGCSVLGGLYFFYMIERAINMIKPKLQKKRRKGSGKSNDILSGNVSTPTEDEDKPFPGTTPEGSSLTSEPSFDQEADEKFKTSIVNGSGNNNHEPKPKSDSENLLSSEQHHHSHHGAVKPVAWMIVIGDATHSFVDGLSIGAAFSESILLGVSISIAVFCEELPHRIGDLAILLVSGLTKKKALLLNVLSACAGYLGFILGACLAEVVDSTHAILGLAGGMFLYISLADMIPEMNHAAEESKQNAIKVFFLQNLGLLLGFTMIFLVSFYSGHIEIPE